MIAFGYFCLSGVALAYALTTNNGPLLVVAFVNFLFGVASVEIGPYRKNQRASVDLETYGRTRAYDTERKRAA